MRSLHHKPGQLLQYLSVGVVDANLAQRHNADRTMLNMIQHHMQHLAMPVAVCRSIFRRGENQRRCAVGRRRTECRLQVLPAL
jgi:hypothetical protein